MNNLASDFIWRVPKQGFRLEDGIYRQHSARNVRGGTPYTPGGSVVESSLRSMDGPQRFFIPNIDLNEPFPRGFSFHFSDCKLPFEMHGLESRKYRPLQEHPSLFREFAFMEPTDQNFLSFVDRWGALGSEGMCEIVRLDPLGREIDQPARYWGELVFSYEMEFVDMHDATVLWDAIRGGQSEVLEKLIWMENGAIHRRSAISQYSLMASRGVCEPDWKPEQFELFTLHGLERGAMSVVEDIVNQGLLYRIHERIAWDDTLERPSLQIAPLSLIGAMWLQLASAIEGDCEYGQCTECTSWFEVSPGSGRPDKRYCSDACRMRAYRQRLKAKRRKRNG